MPFTFIQIIEANISFFRLKHYAGSVTYNVTGFVEKNVDFVPRDLSKAMFECSHPLLKSLFPEGNILFN